MPVDEEGRPERAFLGWFHMLPTFTIGIEEEYQTVDPHTGDLRSHIQAELLEKGKMVLQERVKAELHQSVVEVGTSVCRNIRLRRKSMYCSISSKLGASASSRSCTSGENEVLGTMTRNSDSPR